MLPLVVVPYSRLSLLCCSIRASLSILLGEVRHWERSTASKCYTWKQPVTRGEELTMLGEGVKGYIPVDEGIHTHSR